jgi:hypothetical protein
MHPSLPVVVAASKCQELHYATFVAAAHGVRAVLFDFFASDGIRDLVYTGGRLLIFSSCQEDPRFCVNGHSRVNFGRGKFLRRLHQSPIFGLLHNTLTLAF